MKNIVILGSTGSIGTATIEVVRNSKIHNIVGLAANSNIELLEKQIREFNPRVVAVYNEDKAKKLKQRVKDTSTRVVSRIEGLVEVVAISGVDLAVISVVGMIGLLPTLEAIKNKVNVALATKEVLVAAGELIMKTAHENNVDIIPIDSEHSAIMQCLKDNDKNKVCKVILTASGGPFRGRNLNDLKHVTVEQALNHPNWEMGKKISIDSATLMNKGLEVIEAKWLFNIESDKIDVIVHPQSIIHSMVEYVNSSIIAQLAVADMKLPIQYALDYPSIEYSSVEKLNLLEKSLTFEKPDFNTFKCLRLAYDALHIGGTMPAVLNCSNEIAVDLFLNNKIKFIDIPYLVEECMNNHDVIENPTLKDIFNVDLWVKNMTNEIVN